MEEIILTTDISSLPNDDWLDMDGFEYSPELDLIYPGNCKSPYELAETGYKIGKYFREKTNVKKIVLPEVIDFNLLLGLLQSEVDVKDTVKWYTIGTLFKEPEEYVNFIDLTFVKSINLEGTFISINKEDIMFLNKLITDLKYFINKPHNELSLDSLKISIPAYITHAINENVTVATYDSSTNAFPLIKEVSKASGKNYLVVHANYKPDNFDYTIGIVGKGVHFDTGGYSLKSSETMIDMKRDKTGAITAMMYFILIEHFKLPVEVDLVLGFTENMINTNGYKPGDVIKSYNGRSIEIINTDAEGRLVLADCLEYLDRLNKDYSYIISIATLTGSAVRSFSKLSAPVVTDDISISNNSKISDIANLVGDTLNTVIPHPKLKDTLKSKIADIKNLSSIEEAGYATAYLFLREFTKHTLIHFDIAGPSYTDKQFKYTDFGATGYLLDIFFINSILNLRSFKTLPEVTVEDTDI